MPYYFGYGYGYHSYSDFLANNIYFLLLIPILALLPGGPSFRSAATSALQRRQQPPAFDRRPGGRGSTAGPRRL